MTYDKILETVGSFGLYQKRIFVVLFLCGIPNGMLLNSILYLHYIPDHRCTLPAEYYTPENANQSEYIRNITIPIDARSKCERYNLTRNQIELVISSEINLAEAQEQAGLIECDLGWTFIDHNNIRSPLMEFKSVCEDAYQKPLVSTVFFWGMAMSNSLGFLADRFGRRPVFLLFTLAQFFTTVVASFASNAIVYAVAIFFAGLSQMTNFLIAFVIGVECTTLKYRNFLSIGSFISFSVGLILSSGIFYLISDWRWAMRLMGLMGVLYIPTFWLVPESPRWFLNQNRIEEAKAVIAKFAKINGTENHLEEAYRLMDNQKLENQNAVKKGGFFVQYKQIFSSRRMTIIFLTSVVDWTSIALLYFGLSFSAENLSNDIFTNSVLLALVEFPGLLVAYYVVKYLNRPISHSTMLFIASAACFVAPLLKGVSAEGVLFFVLVGKTAVTGVYYVLFIHLAEIFPTMTRANCLAIASCGGRIGTILSPYLVNMMNVYGMLPPFLILSVLGTFAAALVLLFLPDSRLEEISETVQDTLNMKTVLSHCCRENKENNTDFKEEENTSML